MPASRPNPWPRDRSGKPLRRVRVAGDKNRNVYWRPDAKLEIGYRDSSGKQRWGGPFDTITQARAERDTILGARGRGGRVQPSPRLKFGDAADRWLAEQVVQLRPATRAIYRNAIVNHLNPRWGSRRMDVLDVGDVVRLVHELRSEGLAEWTIAGILKAANRVFKFARRYCGWHGESPISLLEAGERPRTGETAARRIYGRGEFVQLLAAADEPWRTLFRLASVVGPRESELLGLWWMNLDVADVDRASVTFTHQVDRRGVRVPLKTEESKATLPLPRSTTLMLLEHKARSLYGRPDDFVFCTRTARPLSQRNVLRALYRAQEKARNADGLPTFPELFEQDHRGRLVVDSEGGHVLRRVKRRELNLPDFHALRHTAAMECDDAEEARDLLRHKNSNVTRAIYRAHFDDKRREALRARMEARMEAVGRSETPEAAYLDEGEVLDVQGFRTGVS